MLGICWQICGENKERRIGEREGGEREKNKEREKGEGEREIEWKGVGARRKEREVDKKQCPTAKKGEAVS